MNREMSRGDTLVFALQVFRDLTTNKLTSWPINGAPPGNVAHPITGYTMWFTAKWYYTDPDNRAVSQLTNATAAITFTEATTGKALVTMPALATRAFPDGPVTLVYDVQVMDTDGNISTTEAGTILVTPDCTRAIV